MDQEIDDILCKIDNTTFEEDDWNIVIDECSSLAAKWEQVSGFLGLRPSLIASIRGNHPNDNIGCWNDALLQWITQKYNTGKFGEPSWKILLKAIAKVDKLEFKKLAAEHSITTPVSVQVQDVEKHVEKLSPMACNIQESKGDAELPSMATERAMGKMGMGLQKKGNFRAMAQDTDKHKKNTTTMAEEVDDIFIQIDNTRFGEDDWNMVVDECCSLASNWQLLSTFLGLNSSTIDRIKGDFPNNSLGCWSEALKQWIKGNYNIQKYGEASWRTLLRAIAKVDVLVFKGLGSKHQDKPFTLACASQRGDMKLVRQLTEEEQVNPLQKMGNQGTSALHYAAGYGHLDVLKYFVEGRGCNPAIQDNQARTPLHYAALNKHLDVVSYLVAKQKMDLLCCDKKGNTPLHCASQGGDINVVKYLVKELSKSLPIENIVAIKGTDGQAPIHFAAMCGHLEIVQYFIAELNCDPNIVIPVEYRSGDEDRIALHHAAITGHLHIVKYLVEQCNCNPSHLSDERATPLHMAAQEGHLEVVQYLTQEQHCDPLCTDIHNNTPLHRAAICGHLTLLKFFIETMHCSPDIRGWNNETLLDKARSEGHHHIVEYLESIHSS